MIPSVFGKASGPHLTVPLTDLNFLKSLFLRKERSLRPEDPKAVGKKFFQDQGKAAPAKQM